MNDAIRNSLLLMFSGMVTKVNLTYHTSSYVKSEHGGGPAVFRYYGYRIAPFPTNVNFVKSLELRYKGVSAAKKEMEYFVNNRTIHNLQNIKGTAVDLSFIL